MSAPSASRSSGRRAVFAAAALAVSLGFSLVVGEVVARLRGYEPLRSAEVGVEVEGGRYQAADPLLGYRHLPGSLRFHFRGGRDWTATHRADTLRITRPPERHDKGRDPRPGLWIFGCSFVHGWGLDDHETFAWLLQERLPDLDVQNFGVGGYGTLQSLLQFREAIADAEQPPVAVVLGYAGFHEERNTRLRRWRRATWDYDRFGSTAQPYARLGGDGALRFEFDRGGYGDFALTRHSALARWLDDAWSRIEDSFVRSEAVSRALVELFAREVEAAGSVLVVAGISREPATSRMLRFADGLGLAVRDISVDLGRPENAIPVDGHPNAASNRRFARRLLRLLREADIVDAPTEPDPGSVGSSPASRQRRPLSDARDYSR